MSNIAYAGLVERSPEGSYGLYFPDLPGCGTMADSMGELAVNAREALGLYLEARRESGLSPPPATPIEDVKEEDPEIHVVGVLLVEAALDEEFVDVDVSLPSALLHRIDEAADARGLSRSDFLARSARELLKAVG